jgi:hypothetical protein
MKQVAVMFLTHLSMFCIASERIIIYATTLVAQLLKMRPSSRREWGRRNIIIGQGTKLRKQLLTAR